MITENDYTDEQLLLTTVQAARVLGIGRTTVYQLIKDGELHPVHIARSCRISWAELERFVARLDAAGEPPSCPPTTQRRWRRATDASGRRSIFAVETPDSGDPVA